MNAEIKVATTSPEMVAIAVGLIQRCESELLGAFKKEKIPATGIEPVLSKERDFESRASTNSATPAGVLDGRDDKTEVKGIQAEVVGLF